VVHLIQDSLSLAQGLTGAHVVLSCRSVIATWGMVSAVCNSVSRKLPGWGARSLLASRIAPQIGPAVFPIY
jgi:hypothetical protein